MVVLFVGGFVCFFFASLLFSITKRYYSNLRQVYLVSKSAAPIFVGLLMMIVSSVAAVVAICM
jgi:hypothetical protein